MKSPVELRDRLRRQWENADYRAARLLGGSDGMPIELPIGMPPPTDLLSRLGEVKQHIQQWRNVKIGEVVWADRSYRSASEVVQLPKTWLIRETSDWVAACNDDRIAREYDFLTRVLSKSDLLFHELILRRRSLMRSRSEDEILQACRIATIVNPGIAAGRPLRLLSEFETDTKFFERNRSLLLTLLDQRFDNEASRIGLEGFLGAANESEHWLLVHELEPGLLHFPQIRVRASDLGSRRLPSEQILIIENENCRHLLPSLPNTIAILGGGFDVHWTSAKWLENRRVAYWGDIDTWGLKILSDVREFLPSVQALLMDWEIFQGNIDKTVPEPAHASATPPKNLTEQESRMYLHLIESERGRLEQEFIDLQTVHSAIQDWSM